MLLVLLAAVSVLTEVSAVPPLPSAPTPADNSPGQRTPRQIFVSPAGEPFRAGDTAPYPTAVWFEAADANHDGKLTEAEFTQNFLRFCDVLDANHDGVIDADELQVYETTIAPEVHSPGFGGRGREGGWSGHHEGGFGGAQEGGWQGRRGGGGGHHRGGGEEGGSAGYSSHGANRPQGAGRYGILPLPEPVSAMDTNFNGRITREEMTDAADYRFSLLDSGHRGYLTVADLPETFAQTHRKAFQTQTTRATRSSSRENERDN